MLPSLRNMFDEDKEFARRRDAYFANVRAGREAEVAADIGRQALKDFRSDTYEWLTMHNHEERTAYHIAAEAGRDNIMRLLRDRGADVTFADRGGENALHVAAAQGHVHAMAFALETGLPIDAQNAGGATALYRATARGHRQAVALLLHHKAGVDVANKRQQSPLVLAAQEDKREIAALLLNAGASVHASDASGHTPVSYAQERMQALLWFHCAGRGDVAGLRKLLANRIGATGDEGFRELGRALYQPQGQDQLKLNLHRSLLDAKSDDGGFTALSFATQGGHRDAVAYLLSQAADASIGDSARETPLHHAARHGHAAIAALLVEERAPLEALNLGDCTALHVAAFFDHGKVIDELVRANANVHACDANHATPLHLAVGRRHHDATKALINGGASLSVRDKGGRTVGDRAHDAMMSSEKPRPRYERDAADYDLVFEVPPAPTAYEVVHTKMVPVRASPSLSGKVIGGRMPGERVLVEAVSKDGWARCVGLFKEEEQWMLIDGTPHGVGLLLAPAKPTNKAEAEKREQEEAAANTRAAPKKADDSDDDSDDGGGGFKG